MKIESKEYMEAIEEAGIGGPHETCLTHQALDQTDQANKKLFRNSFCLRQTHRVFSCDPSCRAPRASPFIGQFRPVLGK